MPMVFAYLPRFILTPKPFNMLHQNQSSSFVPSLYIKDFTSLKFPGFNYPAKNGSKAQS